MKTMQGALALAFSNKSRTREAPTPTNSSTNSEAEAEKKGTPASPATALANRVLPVPGGPASRQPLGILAPSFVYFSGLFKKSTTSCNSSLAPSTPATSSKRTPVSGTSWNLDLDFPKSMGPPAMPPIPPAPPASPEPRRRMAKRPSSRSPGNSNELRAAKGPPLSAVPSETEMSTPFFARVSTRSGSFGRMTLARAPLMAVSCNVDPSLAKRTRSTWFLFTALMKSLYRHSAPSGSWYSSTKAGAERESANCAVAGASVTCCTWGGATSAKAGCPTASAAVPAIAAAARVTRWVCTGLKAARVAEFLFHTVP
mmetsp:Transcript_41247/g.69397  ORF Transcript_41247/g.69397 Transcript_41247/m.69397 type:complete len:313 (+) Transcript_41247:1978-2916(+)